MTELNMSAFDALLTFPLGMTKEQAVDIIRAKLPCKSGRVDFIDQWNGRTQGQVAILLELDDSLMAGQEFYELQDQGVRLEIEMP